MLYESSLFSGSMLQNFLISVLEESNDRLTAYRQGEIEAVDGESGLANLINQLFL